MREETKVFHRGFYETWYGNAAFVSSRKAKSAYDVDMGEQIPISMVDLNKLLRKAESRHS